MPAHTPGPWRAVLSHDRQPQYLFAGLICVLERSPEQWTSVVAESGAAGADRSTLNANAQLIALAPLLLTGVRAAFHALRSYEHGNHSPALARAAADKLEELLGAADGVA